MPPASVVDTWTRLINVRVGSPITDATSQEVLEAFQEVRRHKGSDYIEFFFKKNGQWRECLDSSDFNNLANWIFFNRSRSG